MEISHLYWNRLKKGFKNWSKRLFKFLCLLTVHIYRAFLSGHMGGCCRYYPTCSSYAIEALEKKSFPESFFLIFRRLLRCHPFTNQVGYDPIDPVLKKSSSKQSASKGFVVERAFEDGLGFKNFFLKKRYKGDKIGIFKTNFKTKRFRLLSLKGFHQVKNSLKGRLYN